MIKKLKNNDFTLMITPLLLAGFGMVMIYSASMVTAVMEDYESTHYLFKQLQWFIIGAVGFIICSLFPYKYYQKLMKIIMLFIIILLIGVLFFGTEVNRAQSWFSFGFISLQPAEFAKLGLIMYLASVYSKKQAYINEFNKGVLPPLILTGFVLGLIVLQPDIGTAAIIFLIACSVIFSSGIKFRHLFILIAAGLLIILVAIPNMVTDERISRFTGAYQPFEHPDDDGYHLIQSYLAIGVGGLTGEGLGNSVQKLGYLTEAHTDFIMAVVAEELGFVGVILVMGMLAIIVLRGIFIARKCEDSFGALLAIGISSMVGVQSFINLGAISGLLPITGVPLPFVSYGGSSLLIMMISMGILNNIARSVKLKEQQPVPAKEKDIPQNINRGGRSWLM
ncbi:putative lipid II flippase FtsW [Virgibacillus dakarensis]|uniref:Probable peptidoglycan glycosyltransferase FtsW n=1 Tax=Lentibacillus populi TaxID=1827502 RepID=A0A9W5TY41_9BACI|nr:MULTISPECIES: putative lipid II flippase FtsW [Bacillaceae]MBT2216167.1 putative lipid II flippase FtsW [Virgibacillus dakarensis]MTW85379.1 putative lipid II flippase FtsW [Virgibacillus dakarensis]GGB44859.1 putative lipid II flippase FtsW [Lentibacillus populi]